MYPTLFDSSFLSVPTYFAAILLGFLGAAYLAWRDARSWGIQKQQFVDFAIWMLILGVLGGRLMHVVADGYFWDYVHLIFDPFALDGVALSTAEACTSNRQCLTEQSRGLDIGSVCNVDDGRCYPPRDPFRWLKFWAGGLTVYGSLLAAVAGGWYFIRKHDWEPWKILDLGGFGIPFGLFVGRLGCFAAGCCFGGVCEIDALGVRFPEVSLAFQDHMENHRHLLDAQLAEGIRASLPVWPTQLFEAGYALLIFLIAYFWVRPHKRFDGQVLLTSALLYGVMRFLVEFLRADQRGEILGLSTSQFVSIPIVLVSGYLLWRGLRAKSNGG